MKINIALAIIFIFIQGVAAQHHENHDTIQKLRVITQTFFEKKAVVGMNILFINERDTSLFTVGLLENELKLKINDLEVIDSFFTSEQSQDKKKEARARLQEWINAKEAKLRAYETASKAVAQIFGALKDQITDKEVFIFYDIRNRNKPYIDELKNSISYAKIIVKK